MAEGDTDDQEFGLNDFDFLFRSGCLIVKSAVPGHGVPIDAVTKARKLMPKSALMSFPLAYIYEAYMVCGKPKDLGVLEGRPETKRLGRQRAEHFFAGATVKPSEKLFAWVASGYVGESSLFLVRSLTHSGGPEPTSAHGRSSYPVPNDEAGLGRCVAALRCMPELMEGLDKFVEAAPNWEHIVPKLKARMAAPSGDAQDVLL